GGGGGGGGGVGGVEAGPRLAAGHVERAAPRRVQRQHVGVGDVAYVDEVPGLTAVFEYVRRGARLEGAAENAGHAGVGRVAGHAWAVHVVVAQRAHRRASFPAVDERELFG